MSLSLHSIDILDLRLSGVIGHRVRPVTGGDARSVVVAYQVQLNRKPGCTAVSQKNWREGYVHRQIGEVTTKSEWHQSNCSGFRHRRRLKWEQSCSCCCELRRSALYCNAAQLCEAQRCATAILVCSYAQERTGPTGSLVNCKLRVRQTSSCRLQDACELS